MTAPTGPLWLRIILVACKDMDPATRTAVLEPGDLRWRLDPSGMTGGPQVSNAIATAKRHGWLTDDSHTCRLTLADAVPLVVVPPEQLASTEDLVRLMGGVPT